MMNLHTYTAIHDKNTRGEKSHGSSLQFRHAEFESSFLTVLTSEIAKEKAADNTKDDNDDGDDDEIKLKFKYSKAFGNATLHDEHGKVLYDGEWVLGKRDGQGYQIYPKSKGASRTQRF